MSPTDRSVAAAEATTSTDHSSKVNSGIKTKTDSTDLIVASRVVVVIGWGTSLQVTTSRTTSSRTVTRTDKTVSIDPTRTLAVISSSSNASETTADREETSLSSRWLQEDATGAIDDHFINFLPLSSRFLFCSPNKSLTHSLTCSGSGS